MPDLRSEYLGLSLRSPLVASSSPLTGDLDSIRRLEDAGAAALVLPSLFEEQLVFESSEIDHLLETGAGAFGEAASYFPEQSDYGTGPDQYLELISESKRAVDIPVIASLNGVSTGGWLEYSKLIEAAGADAIELNVFLVAADPEIASEVLEDRYCALVGSVRDSVEVPIAVKVGPYFSAFAHMAAKLVAAGADGLVLFNRYYQPDIDLIRLEVSTRLPFSTSDELGLPLRWIGILRDRISASLAASSGVHDTTDALKALLVGADAVMMASAPLQRGVRHFAHVESGIREWLEDRDYESIGQLRGSVSQRAVPDPAVFERGNYMRVLKAYSSSFRS